MKKQKNLTSYLKRIFLLTAISLSFGKIKAPIACTKFTSKNILQNSKNTKQQLQYKKNVKQKNLHNKNIQVNEFNKNEKNKETNNNIKNLYTLIINKEVMIKNSNKENKKNKPFPSRYLNDVEEFSNKIKSLSKNIIKDIEEIEKNEEKLKNLTNSKKINLKETDKEDKKDLKNFINKIKRTPGNITNQINEVNKNKNKTLRGIVKRNNINIKNVNENKKIEENLKSSKKINLKKIVKKNDKKDLKNLFNGIKGASSGVEKMNKIAEDKNKTLNKNNINIKNVNNNKKINKKIEEKSENLKKINRKNNRIPPNIDKAIIGQFSTNIKRVSENINSLYNTVNNADKFQKDKNESLRSVKNILEENNKLNFQLDLIGKIEKNLKDLKDFKNLNKNDKKNFVKNSYASIDLKKFPKKEEKAPHFSNKENNYVQKIFVNKTPFFIKKQKPSEKYNDK